MTASRAVPGAQTTRSTARYHDHEWGKPLHGDDLLYELLTLEGFQAGLSWLTILRKRDAFRTAFAGFRTSAVAGFTGGDVDRCSPTPAS